MSTPPIGGTRGSFGSHGPERSGPVKGSAKSFPSFKLSSPQPGEKFFKELVERYYNPSNPQIFNDALKDPKLRKSIEEALIDGKNMAAKNVADSKKDLEDAKATGDVDKIKQAEDMLEECEEYLAACTKSCEGIKNPSYNFEDFKDFCYSILGPPPIHWIGD